MKTRGVDQLILDKLINRHILPGTVVSGLGGDASWWVSMEHTVARLANLRAIRATTLSYLFLKPIVGKDVANLIAELVFATRCEDEWL